MTVTAHEIRQALDEPTVRGIQVLQLGLTVGVVLFAAVTYARAELLAHPATDAAPPDESYLRLLSVANAALLLGAFVAGSFLFRMRTAPKPGDTAAARIEALRAATILRLALFEGAALFGVAVCFLATQAGPPAYPTVWLNLLSPAAFVAFSVATFPNRERLTAVLTDRVG